MFSILPETAARGIEIYHEIGASLVTQMVKNPPAMQEIQVQSLGWEDLLEKGVATHSSILAWRVLWGRIEADTTEQLALALLRFFMRYLDKSRVLFFTLKSYIIRILTLKMQMIEKCAVKGRCHPFCVSTSSSALHLYPYQH